jgi:hypothetical protein
MKKLAFQKKVKKMEHQYKNQAKIRKLSELYIVIRRQFIGQNPRYRENINKSKKDLLRTFEIVEIENSKRIKAPKRSEGYHRKEKKK